jgi:chromosome segregation ATPase
MEFYHRKDLKEPQFEGIRLWEIVRSGRLIPFRETTSALHGPPDEISGDYGFAPLLPQHIQKRYDRLQTLRSTIWRYQRYSEKSHDQIWDLSPERRNLEVAEIHPGSAAFMKARNEFIEMRPEQLRRVESEIAEMRVEVNRLEKEFANFPGIYSRLDLTAFQHKQFSTQLEEAYFRLEQIVSLREVTAVANQPQFSFFKDGTTWAVGPYGREKHFKSVAGFSFIPFILQYPGQTLSALEIYHLGAIDSTTLVELTRVEAGMNTKDLKAAKAVIERLKKRRDTSDDPNEAKRLAAEVADYEQKLRFANRKILGSNELDNARTAVQKGIKKVRDQIKTQFDGSAPDIVRELNQIFTGYDCYYASQTSWRLFP